MIIVTMRWGVKMIDIHCHILPRIDDGSKDMEQSVRMAEVAAKDGISAVIATPHFNDKYPTDPFIIKEKVIQLNQKLEEKGISLQVLPGMESHFSYEYIELLQKGKLLTLGTNSKFVFLELPFQQIPHRLDHLVYQIKMAGYSPIIPHPERTLIFHERPHKLYELVKNGVITQVNAGSVLGFFGNKVRKFTKEMFEHGLLHILASDAHDDKKRPPRLSEGYIEIAELVGKSYVNMMKENAKNIAYGKDFWVEEPIRPHKKKFWLFG